jgi:hypothetical protein
VEKLRREAAILCRESLPLRSRECPYPFIASIKSKPSLTSLAGLVLFGEPNLVTPQYLVV